MHVRRLLRRWVYGSFPGLAGRFPYFGVRVYFPKRSTLFYLACDEGIFEAASVRLLQGFVRPGSWYFDVGANIGLMAIPILTTTSDVNVLSFEPSSNVLPFLRRTILESSYATRWQLLETAVGPSVGRIEFHLGPPEEGALDGIRHTNRAPLRRTVPVEMTSLDAEWQKLGQPDVSAIKIDVEGGELGVLQGGLALLRALRPPIVLEWQRENLAAYNCAPSALIDFAREHDYRLYSLPILSRIADPAELNVHMLQTENFVLLP